MQKSGAAVAAALCLLLSMPSSSRGQTGANEVDQQKALAAARAFATAVKEGKFNTAWTSYASAFMKERGNQDQFVANLAMGRANVGLQLSSKLIDVTYHAHDVQSGYKGDIYTVRFLNTYERGKFFEFIVLIKDKDGQWRVSGLGGTPGPTD